MAESKNDLDFKNVLKTDDVKSAENSENVEAKANDSDEVFEMCCETCMRDGINKTACAFCPSCVAYFCSTCLINHGKFLRKHTFVEGDDMYSDICLEKCEIHSKEIIKFYCETCEKIVCTICKDDLHTDTCSLRYLPDLDKDVEIENELKLLHSDHKSLNEKMSNCKNAISSKREHLSNMHEETQCDIKSEKDKTFEKYDNETSQIDIRIQTINKTDSSLLDSLKETSESLTIEIDKMSVNIKNLKTTPGKSKYKMLIDLKLLKDKVKHANTSVDTLGVGKSEPDLEKQLRNISKEVKEFGTLMRSVEPKVQNEGDINNTKNACFSHDIFLKADGDTKPCSVINCCTLSDQYLVVCDKNNCSLKLFDMKNNKLIHTKSVNESPVTVAKINDHQIAYVHEYDENKGKIQFLNLTDFKTLKFLKKKYILTEMFCSDVAYFKDDKLIISLIINNEGKVQIIDMKGRVLVNIGEEINGNFTFQNPYCLSVDNKARYAYVSDWYKVEIIEIDLETFNTRSVAYMWHPEGIATDDEGFVYVIESGSNKLFYFNPHQESFEKVELLKDKPTDWSPLGICFCSVEKKLYVGQNDNDTMKVFKLTDGVIN